MSASAAATFVNNLPLVGAQSEIAKRHANRDIAPQLACAGLAEATTCSRVGPHRGARAPVASHCRLPDAKSPRTRATPATRRSFHRHVPLIISPVAAARLIFRPRERMRRVVMQRGD